MESRTQERVERWDSRPFGGDPDELASLADAEFSGAISAAGTWLFMLNGRIVGVVGGDLEDVDTSGTIYDAPDPALPLLAAMQTQGGETRANYYTNETPLSEVDETLQEGSFTGYIELSEQVLSGDYYLVYYGGRRMAAAYVGNAERLFTGDEAFERAADEVGIYEVVDVDLEVTDLRDRTESASSEPDAGATSTDRVEETSSGSASGTARTDTGVGTVADEPAVDTDVGTDPEQAATGSPSRSGDISSEIGSITEDLSEITSGTAGDDEPATERADAATDVDPSPARDGSTTEPDPTADRDPAEPADSGTADATPADGDDHPVSDERSAADGTNMDPSETATGSAADAGDTPDPDAGSEPAAETTTDTSPGITVDAATDVDETADAPSSTADSSDAALEFTATDDAGPAASSDDSTDVAPGAGTGTSEADSTAASEPDDEPADDSELEQRFEQEKRWRKTRRIPSIDPDNTSEAASASRERDAKRAETTTRRPSSDSSESASRRESATSQPASRRESAAEAGSQTDPPTATTDPDRRDAADTPRSEPDASRSGGDAADASRSGGDAADVVERLRSRIDQLEQRHETLTSQREELVAERDRLESENQELAATVERLEARIDDLESELERARSASADADVETEAGTDGAVAASGPRLSPTEAIAGTNLFVRYDSKGNPTLETAHAGEADASEVSANLRLERHTSFEDSGAVVDGESYEEFLPATMEYQFVDWLVDDLLYEIRDTGHTSGLQDLYDVIPEIHRVELDASISLADDDTEDVPDEVTFDVVAFDKMGNPLVVAALDDDREPATESLLAGLEEAASAVKANYPELGAAFAVTASYFQPGALEVSERATSGGLLSRSSKLNYVNLSRKEGYHLCLVEAQSGGFHVTVPEL